MGCEVYANGMEIACKAADGKTIAAFPDVCFTPPLTPATPPGVPIPYPNTAMASDTTDGTKTVQISGQEVMLKDKSCFKTSTGDEAGSAPKKGVVTSKIKGKANFCAWSMDVKFEGANVPRHLDLTLHNEASPPANTPTWPYTSKMAAPGSAEAAAVVEKCKKDRVEIQEKYGKLGKELRKYDPVSDAKGGFLSHVGTITKPGGHYKKIKDLQRGLKNDLTAFQKECSGSGVKIDKKVDNAANQTIVKPPGIP